MDRGAWQAIVHGVTENMEKNEVEVYSVDRKKEEEESRAEAAGRKTRSVVSNSLQPHGL